MQNQSKDDEPKPTATEASTSVFVPEIDDWEMSHGNDDDEHILRQQSDIRSEEALKVPFVSDKEPLSSLAAEYESGSPILLQKIKVLGEQYAAIRRTRGDGNCFFRSFMFSYLEHVLESQDQAEVDRIKGKVEECGKTLQSLGHAEFTFEDFFALFLEQLDSVIQGNETSVSHDELLIRCQVQSISDYVVMFFRFVTSGEIRKRSEFFEPFILGLTNATVEQFCKSSVDPMGEESDHVHITALSDALGVPIRVIYLDRSSCDSGGISVNHHDFLPTTGDLPHASNSTAENITPFVRLLYRPGHYDILYPK
jgi:ubiquitin thioesterase protein OTUB1